MFSATKSRLAGAYNGYKHQDALTAYALVTLLLPATSSRAVTVENKVVPGDKFDDLEIIDSRRCRVQIKSHTAEARPLRLADLTTHVIDFRLDQVLSSFVQDATPADEYRLFTTYFPPEEDLLHYLLPDRITGSLLPGIRTLCYRLDAQQIWPAGQSPAWRSLLEAKREDFLTFCQRFVVETGCPVASGDLHAPSLLEQGILRALSEQVGIGSWPNHQRRVEDVAALLMQTAMNARTSSQTFDEQSVIKALALRVDYGRVHEQLPVAEARLVLRSDSLIELTTLLDGQQHVAVVGNPGMGKSWLLHQAAMQLKQAGWAVAVHYCFIDLLDVDREARASINTMFGSLIAELREVLPQISHSDGPRFAAGAATLECLLAEAQQRVPAQRIALIVDGIDHVDRIGNQATGASSRLILELANLRLPPGVALIIGSQPGHHLQEFPFQDSQLRLSRWPDELLRGLLEQTELRQVYHNAHRTADTERLLTTITEKAGGSPLYATYLVKTALTHVRDAAPLTATGTPVVDVAAYLATLPAPDVDLHNYYRWLLDGLAAGTRAWWVAELLALLDFPVSAIELKEINPGMAHQVQRALSCLAPVLSEETAYGGLRIYHESFQRYVRQVLRDDEADSAALLQPVIQWLGKRGFYADLRAFRHLPSLLRAASQLPDMLALVDDDFVAKAAANGQPADAVLAVLTIVAEVAADQLAWPELTRLVELARAATNLYYERLPGDDMAEQYGRAYATLHGADALAARLLHDGRCTFPVESGLILCQLCDQQTGAAPWSEYLALLAQQASKEYGLRSENSQAVAPAAQMVGHLRLAGREKAPKWCEQALLKEGRVHPFQQLTILGEMYGVEAIEEVETMLPSEQRELRAWAVVAAVQVSDWTAHKQPRLLPTTIYNDLPPENWRLPLRLGADPANAPRHPTRLAEATTALLEPETIDVKVPLNAWLTELALASALGEEEMIARTRLQIPPTFWFRRWLHFCLVLAQPTAPDALILAALRELSEDEELFIGKPSVSSSLFAQEEIQRSFRKLLKRIDEVNWTEALRLLVTICRNTALSYRGSRSGPLTPDALIDLCLESADTASKRQLTTEICRELFAFEARSGGLYDTHATDQLRLVRMLVAIGQEDEALVAWHEACRFLASYGFHKDITFYEILDPIQSLATADLSRARQCLTDIQPIIEGIRRHTDGKETYYAIHGWLDLAAQIHPAGALAYLAHEKTPLICAVGDLDHAWPIALTALAGCLEPLTEAAAWLASGSQARQNPAQALAACQQAAQVHPAGLQLWHGVAAALDGEGTEPVVGLQELLADSAGRLGLPTPAIESFPAKQESVSNTLREQAARCPDPFLLPSGASPAHLAYAVRQWQNQPEATRASPTALVNALGWRMAEMYETGATAACQELLWQLARSLFRWSGNALLLGLAEGFALRDFRPLAALAYTLAYTRSTDGWRRFGKVENNHLFVTALQLDDAATWAALAQEIADGVAQGGEYGLTLHAIELLVAGGRSTDAFAAWEAAYRIIALRVPVTGPYDTLDHSYEPSWEGAENWLATLIMARLNQCELQDKRVALAALVTMARYQPAAVAFGLQFALEKDLPASSLTSVLHMLYFGEQAPYPATSLAKKSLRAIAAGKLVTARVLARHMLVRLGEITPFPPADAVPTAPRVSHVKAEQILKCIGAERTRRIATIWPRFGPTVVGPLDQALSSEIIAQRMENFVDNTGLRHHRVHSVRHLWSPMQEEAERVLQIVGTATRTALAGEGEIDPENETRLGIALLGKTELSLRLTMSRCLRPTYIPQPGAYPVGTTTSALLTVLEGPYQDWIVLGWHETRLQIGGRYDKEPIGEVTVYAGVEFTLTNAVKSLPFGVADCSVWTTELQTFSRAFREPAVGLDITSDNFGGLEILCPYANFITANSLKPASCEQGLMLIDSAGAPALVSLNWRQRLLEEERVIADRTPMQHGVCLLVRPDVFANTLKWAVEPPQLTILTVHKEIEAP